MHIIAHILRIISGIFDVKSANAKDTKKVYIYNGIYNILLGIQYYLLGAITGAVSSFLATLRNVIFSKVDKKSSIYVLILYLIIAILLNIPAYDGIISILPIIMVIMYSIAIYKANIMKIKYTTIITCILEIIYDIYYHAYIGIVVCIIDIIFVAISITKIKKIDN